MSRPAAPAAQIDVAAEVRAQLARAQWTGRRMALKLGWTQPYISRRLNGDVPFDVNDLAAIAGVLGIPVSAFFETPDFDRGPLPARPPARRGQLRRQLLYPFGLRRWAPAA